MSWEAMDGVQATRMTQSLRRCFDYDVTIRASMTGDDAPDLSKVPETNILILTMHESDQMVRRILEAGARGYILKSDLAGPLVWLSAVSQRKDVSDAEAS